MIILRVQIVQLYCLLSKYRIKKYIFTISVKTVPKNYKLQ